MARTNLVPNVPVGAYPGTLTAGAADLTFTASDIVNHNSFKATGREVLLVKNTDAAPHHVTIHSAPDELGRTGDITSYAVGAGKTSGPFLFPLTGYRQSDGTVWVDGDDVTVQLAVITLPVF